MYWNMSFPPSTACLAAALGGLPASHWSREVAAEPRTLTSLTIRIAGVARPVVVFAAELGHPIRIVDVMRAVYGALCRAALESVQRCVVGGISTGDRNSSAVAAGDSIRRHFRGGVWWGGLCESTDERDVWILEIETRVGTEGER
jgi:cytochrome c biogenesis factor